MKTGFALLMGLIVASVANAVIPEGELAELLREVKTMRVAINQGNAEVVLPKIHPAIYRVAGGQENYEKVFGKELKQLKASKVKAHSVETLPPPAYYNSGEDLLCFVPTLMVVELDGRKIRVESFMVAARGPGQAWRYLDGNPIWHNPRMIRQLFPGLPEIIRFPPHKNTVIQEP